MAAADVTTTSATANIPVIIADDGTEFDLRAYDSSAATLASATAADTEPQDYAVGSGYEIGRVTDAGGTSFYVVGNTASQTGLEPAIYIGKADKDAADDEDYAPVRFRVAQEQRALGISV
jgi:type II secretory pathway component HofQ